MGPYEAIWNPIQPYGAIWDRLGPSAAIWDHMGPYEAIWDHLRLWGGHVARSVRQAQYTLRSTHRCSSQELPQKVLGQALHQRASDFKPGHA